MEKFYIYSCVHVLVLIINCTFSGVNSIYYEAHNKCLVREEKFDPFQCLYVLENRIVGWVGVISAVEPHCHLEIALYDPFNKLPEELI